MSIRAIPRRSGGAWGRLAGRLRAMLADRPGLVWRYLGVAAMLGVLPMVAAVIIVPRTMTGAFAEISRDYLGQVAQHLASTIEMEMRRHADAVSAVSKIDVLRTTLARRNSGVLRPSEIATANEQLVLLIQSQSREHQGVFLCDREGIIFAGSLRSGDATPYAHIDIRDRGYFQKARDTGRIVVSEITHSKVDDAPIVVIAVPVHDDSGGFGGLVGLGIEIGHVSDFIVSQSTRQLGTPFAVDRSGTIIAHQDTRRMFHGTLGNMPGLETLSRRMTRSEIGFEAYRLPDGTEKLAAFAPVPLTGWSVAVSMRSRHFVAASRGVQKVILTLVLAFAFGGVLVVVSLALCLEQLRQTLAEVRTSNHRFKLLAAAVGDVIWDHDLATGEFSLSDDSGRVSGGGDTASSLEGLMSLVPEGERSVIDRGIEVCRRSGQWTGEHHTSRKGGGLRYVLHRMLLIRNAGGQPDHIVGRLTDITERRMTEERLARQAALLDKTRDGIMVLDLDQTIRYWNLGAAEIFGWTLEEALARRQDELLTTDVRMAMERVVETGEWFGTLEKRTKNGAKLTVDCRWTLLRNDRGEPQAILTLDTDITERMQMEARFRRAQRLESIGTLAGGIAHDFNNLLSPIVLGVEVLKRATHGTEPKRTVATIEECAQRATSLVRQILSFARGEAGARVSVLLDYVIREVESIASRTFPRNIEVRVNVQKDLWLIRADPTQMSQVLMNLCVNARDAMPEGGRLTISARNEAVDESIVATNRGASTGRHVVLEVVDTGTGISAANLERIFEPFFTTKAVGSGTGLGLSTVIGIARDHGGFVNVHSEEGRGSVFKVYLPASDSGVTKPDAAAAPGVHLGHGELVLLVDDDALVRSVTRQVLEGSGYRVVAATDGAHALSIFRSHRARISVVVTDMMMPVMDGPALIEAIRRVDPKMCVVGASGQGESLGQIKGTRMNLRHLLSKPYTTAALLEAIRAALDDRRMGFAQDGVVRTAGSCDETTPGACDGRADGTGVAVATASASRDG